MRHHRKAPTQGLAQSRSSAQGRFFPGILAQFKFPDGPQLREELPSLGRKGGSMIAHRGFFARHCSAARSALWWDLLRNLGGAGALSESIIFLWEQGPRMCVCAYVH